MSANAIPSVYLGGTSKDVLIEQYWNALEKLDQAIAAIEEAAPNGRDFIPTQHEIVFNLAQREHAERIAALKHVKDDYGKLIAAVNAGGFKR